MFALVKCRLKPAQQDKADANIELEFPFCNRKSPLWAHNTGFPGFVLPPSGGWVFLWWDQTWWAEQRAAEEETDRSQLNLSAQETDENRHEGRQSFQVCYNLRCMVLQFAETLQEMQLTMTWVLLRWDLVFDVWCRVDSVRPDRWLIKIFRTNSHESPFFLKAEHDTKSGWVMLEHAAVPQGHCVQFDPMRIIIRIIDLLLILSSHATTTLLCQTETTSVIVIYIACFVQLHIALLFIIFYVAEFKLFYSWYISKDILFNHLIIVGQQRCNVGFIVSKVNREYNL